MKVNGYIYNVLGVCGFAMLLASCSEFDYESHYPGGAAKKEYEKNWVKEFGSIDPNQTWNMCQDYSVTVNTSELSDIQIYANEGDAYHIVADYKDVYGTQTLQFDAIPGVEEVYVSDGNTFKHATLGQIVDFGSDTRSSIFTHSDDWRCSVKVLDNDYFDFGYSYLKQYVLGEGNTKPNQEQKGILATGDKVSRDFSVMTSSGNVVVYPLFMSHNKEARMGVYFRDRNYYPTFDVFSTYPTTGDVYAENTFGYTVSDYETIEWFSKNENGSTSIPSKYKDNSKLAFRSKGIEISVEPGSELGFYACLGNHLDKKYYSESKMNLDGKTYNAICYDPVNNLAIIGLTTDGDSRYYDLVFAVKNVVVIDKTNPSWIIACEDLGSTDMSDSDFNDLVFKVEYTSGERYVKVTPLAAGGSRKAVFTMGAMTNDSYEIHECFGYESDNGNYPIINTGSTVNGKTAEPIEFAVNGGYSLTSKMGGMTVKVYNESQNEQMAYNLSAPDEGKAPQMLLLPSNWAWPKEKEPIYVAYPKFDIWNSDSMLFDWYKECRSEVLYRP